MSDQEKLQFEAIPKNIPVLPKESPSYPIVSINPEALISQAIDKELTVDTMERLLAMRKELKQEAAQEAYFQALSIFQEQCPVIERKKKVYDKSKVLRFKYAPLEDIVRQVAPLLRQFGFSYSIKTKQSQGWVTAVCESHHIMGHTERTEFSVPIDEKAYMNAPQKVASALTFSKRYAFCDSFGIVTGDDDDSSEMVGPPERGPIEKEKQSQPKSVAFKDAPEENQGMYQTVMILLREKQDGQDLFALREKEQYKKSADTVLMDIEKLKSLYSGVNRLAMDRRKKIKEGVGEL